MVNLLFFSLFFFHPENVICFEASFIKDINGYVSIFQNKIEQRLAPAEFHLIGH